MLTPEALGVYEVVKSEMPQLRQLCKTQLNDDKVLQVLGILDRFIGFCDKGEDGRPDEYVAMKQNILLTNSKDYTVPYPGNLYCI